MPKFFQFAISAALAGTALASIVTTEAVAATAVFSNLNPVGSFDRGGSAKCVNGPNGLCGSSRMIIVAQPFQPAQSGMLDHLDLAIANYGEFSGALGTGVAVALVTDNGSGTAPKRAVPALEQWIIAKEKYVYADYATMKPTKVASKLHPVLTAGTTYWVILTATSYDGSTVWFSNSTGKTAGLTSLDGGTTWQASNVSAAFDVWKK